jgi:hypothetical protein
MTKDFELNGSKWDPENGASSIDCEDGDIGLPVSEMAFN